MLFFLFEVVLFQKVHVNGELENSEPLLLEKMQC